jgi:hypothetical protein
VQFILKLETLLNESVWIGTDRQEPVPVLSALVSSHPFDGPCHWLCDDRLPAIYGHPRNPINRFLIGLVRWMQEGIRRVFEAIKWRPQQPTEIFQ